jgi:D-alanine-D-alanine ligase-like ATP-grasp enzyme
MKSSRRAIQPQSLPLRLDLTCSGRRSSHDRAHHAVSAKLSKAQAREVREMAIAAFYRCHCFSLAASISCSNRKATPGAFSEEGNAMRGFTSISIYPKLWEASGLKYSDPSDRPIELALGGPR